MLLFYSTWILRVTKRMFLFSDLLPGIRGLFLYELSLAWNQWCQAGFLSPLPPMFSYCILEKKPRWRNTQVTAFSYCKGCFRENNLSLLGTQKIRVHGCNTQHGKLQLDCYAFFKWGQLTTEKLPRELEKSVVLVTSTVWLDKSLGNGIKLGSQLCYELRVK